MRMALIAVSTGPNPSPRLDISPPRIDQLVDVGGRKLHGRVYGTGSPAIVLISGFRAPQEYWDPIVPALASITTVITYDRAGYGKSELGSLPCDGNLGGDHLLPDLCTIFIGLWEPSDPSAAPICS